MHPLPLRRYSKRFWLNKRIAFFCLPHSAFALQNPYSPANEQLVQLMLYPLQPNELIHLVKRRLCASNFRYRQSKTFKSNTVKGFHLSVDKRN